MVTLHLPKQCRTDKGRRATWQPLTGCSTPKRWRFGALKVGGPNDNAPSSFYGSVIPPVLPCRA